jgi:hypothetical protein
MKFKINEHVRIKAYPKDGINGYGRVDFITGTRYRVVNLNMPYQGTVCNFFEEDELEKQ